MTASEKEYVNMTAKITAETTVKEFRKTLNCDKNVGRISELEQTVNDGIKEGVGENRKSIRILRKILFGSMSAILLTVITLEIMRVFG